MHAIFMLYGLTTKVDFLLKEMQHQKFQLALKKKGEKDKFIWIQGHLRILPFGLYEFIFPREYMDVVLTTLRFNMDVGYSLDQEMSILGMKIRPMKYLKKFLKIEDTPKFKDDKKLIWIMDDVAVVHIGIRKDADHAEKEGEYKGWTHEAI